MKAKDRVNKGERENRKLASISQACDSTILPQERSKSGSSILMFSLMGKILIEKSG